MDQTLYHIQDYICLVYVHVNIDTTLMCIRTHVYVYVHMFALLTFVCFAFDTHMVGVVNLESKSTASPARQWQHARLHRESEDGELEARPKPEDVSLEANQRIQDPVEEQHTYDHDEARITQALQAVQRNQFQDIQKQTLSLQAALEEKRALINALRNQLNNTKAELVSESRLREDAEQRHS